MIEQNQQLQSELEQALLAHRTDAEGAKQMTQQTDVQFQSDFRAMKTEFEWRQAEWQEKACVEKEQNEVSAHAWEVFMQKLQDDHAKQQKELEEVYRRHDADLEKTRAQQEDDTPNSNGDCT